MITQDKFVSIKAFVKERLLEEVDELEKKLNCLVRRNIFLEKEIKLRNDEIVKLKSVRERESIMKASLIESIKHKDKQIEVLTCEVEEVKRQSFTSKVFDDITSEKEAEDKVTNENFDEDMDSDSDIDMVEWDSHQDFLSDDEQTPTSADTTALNQDHASPDNILEVDEMYMTNVEGSIEVSSSSMYSKEVHESENVNEATFNKLINAWKSGRTTIHNIPEKSTNSDIENLLKDLEDQCYNFDDNLGPSEGKDETMQITKVKTNFPHKRKISMEQINKNRKGKKCQCNGCSLHDCNKCRFCLDRPSNGGPDKLRHRCVLRVCTRKFEHVRVSAGTFICPIPGCKSKQTRPQNVNVHIASVHFKSSIEGKIQIKTGEKCKFRTCNFSSKRRYLYYHHYGFVHKMLTEIDAEH